VLFDEVVEGVVQGVLVATVVESLGGVPLGFDGGFPYLSIPSWRNR